ncbi:uncharacterized protein LOC135829133 [Sycon ciliatum]|uniref:uncharacterized protein LOC135829133 n=1 Tax=Sycon ciliatum TaxID=27933 RepID=UPI0031F635F0
MDKRPELKAAYGKVICSHIDKGYVRAVSAAEVEADCDDQWFLLHFVIVRDDKATTKVRVVFDAAAKYDGTSINECMYAGPTLQNDLVKVLLRFCKEPVVLTADITEMFLQVVLAEQDRRYHGFVWDSRVYEFERLVFGIKASPYLACKALQVVCRETAANMTQPCCRSLTETSIRTQQTVQDILEQCSFHLRKWLRNSSEVMEGVLEADRSPQLIASINDHDHCVLPSVKTLGVMWSAEDDTFAFEFKPPATKKLTKRAVLSKMASIFDPRGQLAPFTIRARVMFQELYILGVGGDDPLDAEHTRKWKSSFSELGDLALIRAPRYFKCPGRESSVATLSMHMFTDASDAAYTSNVYVHAEYPDGNVQVKLALAKARPCPITKMLIPKLELKGGMLGVCLAQTVNDELELPKADATYWSDSMNVLHWVRAHCRNFKVDVGNRIAEAQKYLAGNQWNHVSGKLNLADKSTRGLTAAQLASDSVWWSGHEFLVQQHNEWPSRQITMPKELPGMVKRVQVMAFAVQQVSTEVFHLHPNNYSSCKRLVRLMAWCYRFINRCRRRHASRRRDPEAASTAVDSVELKSEELQRAECHWYAIAQAESYLASYRQLTSGKSLAANDPLLRLNPVLDKD